MKDDINYKELLSEAKILLEAIEEEPYAVPNVERLQEIVNMIEIMEY